jgi:hypothetical protein
MTIRENPAERRCELWIPNAERETYRSDPAFQSVCRRYRELGYQVCAYVGGQDPLLPSVTALLDGQNCGLI